MQCIRGLLQSAQLYTPCKQHIQDFQALIIQGLKILDELLTGKIELVLEQQWTSYLRTAKMRMEV